MASKGVNGCSQDSQSVSRNMLNKGKNILKLINSILIKTNSF